MTYTIDSNPAVKTALQAYADSRALAGAVALVADSSGILTIDTVGYSNVASGRPMRRDSLFWIASQTKPFISAAIMTLVEAGQLKLNDPVTQYIPEFRDQWFAAEQTDDHLLLRKPSNEIRIEDLLNHTSGMPFASRMERPTLDGLTSAERINSYVMTPLLSEPGTQYRYSNAGVETAARIVELLTGKSVSDYLDAAFLHPLGMHDTTFWPDAEQVSRLASAYGVSEADGELQEVTISQLQYPLTDRNRTAMAAGGLFSTAADVSRFCRMFLNGGELDGKRYLSAESIQVLTTGRHLSGADMKVGLCWFVDDRLYTHGGALSTNMSVYPSESKVLVYLVQHSGFPRDGGAALDAFKQAALAD